MTFEELEQRMRADGYTWDGDGPGDTDGAFLKENHLTMTIAQAIEHLRHWRNPGDELRG